MKFRMIVSSVVALAAIGCATPTQLILDAEVDRLCAIDGGVRVYETIKLPADKFNQWGQVNFYRPTQGENALGSEYILNEKTKYIQQGNPQLARHYYVISRRSDGRVLGETVLYGRGGGGVPGPWHESSYTCPSYAEAGLNALMKNIFTAQNGGAK